MIIVLLLGTLLVLQLPVVQTSIARFVTGKLQGAIDGRIEIGSVQIHPFNAVTVKDVCIIDDNPCPDRYGRGCGTIDTLARIGHISVTLSPRSLFSKGGIHLGRVDADDVLFQLAIEPGEEYSANITRIFRLGGSSDSTMPLDTLFSIHRLNVTNARYRMVSLTPNPYSREYGIDFLNLDASFNVKAHDIGLRGGRMCAVVDKLDMKEKCGYEVYDLSGSCQVGQGHANIRNLKMRDVYGSDLRLPKVDFNYEGNPTAWSNFLKDVELDVTFGQSHLVFASISAFSGSVFKDCPLQAEITGGRFKGPISNFRVTGLTFKGTECDVSGSVDCSISGIPSTQQMYFDGEVHDVKFTSNGLTKVLADLGMKADLSKLAKGTVFTANGGFTGFLKDLKGNLRLHSGIGSAKVDANVRNITVNDKPITFRADIAGTDFNLGRLLGTESLGPTTFTAKAGGVLGSKPAIRLEKMDIANLNALGYDYSDISLNGMMVGQAFQAMISSSDPNAFGTINANLDLSNKTGRIEAELTEVDLATLNIDKRGGRSVVSCYISAEQGLYSDQPAQIIINDLTLTNDSGVHVVGDILTQARVRDKTMTLILNSDAFDAKYHGTSNIGGLISDLREVTVNRYLPTVFAPGKEPTDTLSTNSCSFSAVFHETRGMLDFLLPGLSIDNDTAINVDLDGSGRLLGYISSPGIKYNNISAQGFDVSLGNLDESLGCTVSADRLGIGNLPFNKVALLADAISDRIGLSLNYESAEVLDGGSELYVDAAFTRDQRDSLVIDINTLPSQITIKGDTWEMSESLVRITSGMLDANGFELACEDQSISIDGGIRKNDSDTLSVHFRELDLSLLSEFLGEKIPTFSGILDGDVTLLSPLPSKMGLFAGLVVDGLTLNGIPAGDFLIDSDWDDKTRTIAFDILNTYDDRDALQVTGNFGTKSGILDATAVLDKLNANVASPFLGSILSELGGQLSGSVNAKGKINNLALSSDDLRLDGVCGRVKYTNVFYTLNGTVGITDNNTLTFNNIGVKDAYGGMGVLQGSLALGNFKSPRIDASLDMNRLKAIDIPGPESYIRVYGDLSVSGNGRVRGPFNALGIDGDVITAGSGLVNVPISASSAASEGDLLTFTKPPVEGEEEAETVQVVKRKSDGGIVLHARVRVSPEVIANVEIDKDTGHGLTAGGTADVVLDLNTAKQRLDLKGDYLIDKGKYLFNIPGILSKEFDIKEGSTIKFNGNILESALNINAVHNVKTSLGTLVADTTAIATRRNVECGLKIGGKLRSPEVSFSIDIPDLDPSAKVAVDAALNTTDKVQKQFVALLLFGTFIPEDNSGVVDGNNMIYSNVGEIVAGQVNSILQKLDIPVDIGLGYQQDNVGTDIFDVAVSTQLFNNRLIVGGSLGNRRYSTSKSVNGDIVGDLDIELKLDKSGDLRFKLFSHSADEYTSNLDFSQRNGFGFSYQKEFNKIGEFFRQLFMSRKRKSEEAIAEAGKKKEYTVIEIEE